jgi:hypothetical protein
MSKIVTLDDIGEEEILQLKELHRKMEIGYAFPNITSPLFAIRKAVIRESGKVSAAAALKLTAEAFLWIDPEMTATEKTEDILRLAQMCHERAKDLSLEDVTAWIPPQVEPIFGNMLSRMGWSRSPWASWSVKI